MSGKSAKAEDKRRRARGDGGLFQRKDGRWVGRVELRRDSVTGKRRTKLVTDMDYDACMVKLNKMKHDLIDNGDLPTGSETVAKWMNYWMESIDQSRPTTRNGYRSKIKYIVAAIGNIKIDQLTTTDVRKLETYMVKKLKLSPTSALQAYQVLAKALKDAERDGRVTRNVARLVDPPRRAVPKLKILTTPEAVTLIGSVTEERLGSRIAAALLIGARQGELLGLEWNRVDLDEATIDLSWQLQRVAWRHGCDGGCGRKRGTDCPERRLDAPADWEHRHITGGLYFSRPKSKAGWRVIPLEEPLYSILQRRREASLREPNPHGLVWTSDPKMTKHTHQILPLDGSPIDPSRDSEAWHQALANCGLEKVIEVNGKKKIQKRVRLHDARHTAVTLMYDRGIAETTVQDTVGQSTISTTRGYRLKSMKLQREALRMVGQEFAGQLVPATPQLELPASV